MEPVEFLEFKLQRSLFVIVKTTSKESIYSS